MLAATGLLLAWSLFGMVFSPILLARPSWPSRRPRLALALWCGVFGSGVVCVLASLAVVLSQARGLSREVPTQDIPVSHVTTVLAVTGVGCLLTAVVGGVGALAVYRAIPLVRARGRARRIVSTARAATPQARVVSVRDLPRSSLIEVESHHPLARSLPGRRPVILVSKGLRDVLTREEFDAVLEHERFHLRQRHGLLAQMAALQRACTPGLPCARALERSVLLLMELAADDGAARRHGPLVAASALGKIGSLDRDPSLPLRAARLASLQIVDNA